MSQQLNFYHDIPSVSEFIEVMNPNHYHEAPEAWLVVMTDVKGSTVAIRAGRYRDVNLLGAAGITAVLNVVTEIDLPYVFGGDGATLLIPESSRAVVEQALRGVQKLSREKFGLELRAGIVPVKKLHEMGTSVQVAKYELSEGNVLAQFRGGGINKAEELIKNDSEGLYNLVPQKKFMAPPNLKGLSCRLEPFENQKGTMLTLLVASRAKQGEVEIYRDVLAQIELILGHDLRSANPVTKSGLRWKWPPRTTWMEAKSQSSGWNFPAMYFLTLLRSVISHVLLRGTKVVGGFDPTRYKKELVINTDCAKFDDVLRMVVDCSETQADRIEAYLQDLHTQGRARYGVHRSPQAVMTCMVFSASENRHLHFVDGSHGGYAMAAVGLKGQSK